MGSFKVVGISVSRETLNVCYGGKRMAYIRNSPGGLETLLTAVRAQAPDLVAIEQCDGLERPIAEALSRNGIATDVLGPVELTAFARATGRVARNGGLIDARMLCSYATKRRSSPWLLLPAALLLASCASNAPPPRPLALACDAQAIDTRPASYGYRGSDASSDGVVERLRRELGYTPY